MNAGIKNFLLVIFTISLSIFSGCLSSSKPENFYGWWKPETKSAFGNRDIFISKDILKDNKSYKILNWEKKDNDFLIVSEVGAILLHLDDKGYLHVTPQNSLSGTYIFSKTTEEEAKKRIEEKQKKWEKMTTPTKDPF